MGITQVKVRARITIGTSLIVETPYILKFDVNKVRGQISTFSASLKVHKNDITRSIAGDHIKIYAGENYANNVVFSGIVKSIIISPCWDDPQYVYMNLSGEDILSILRGKKYTRRSTATTSSWISIDSVARKGLRSGKFKATFENRVDTLPADVERDTAVETTALGNLKLNDKNVKDDKKPGPSVGAHNVVSPTGETG
jgi:hypothetical protein